ncbi:hypothetical protein MKY41_16245 [Sporosarcina sp. FSL W7-1349]|uniref:hypothetical protein n=1 Tax=Sporosarcina sp. FSL W7-1349 TaxID=2921561 RepID=UPI0030F63829
MKRPTFLLAAAVLLLAVSFGPLFVILREGWIDWIVKMRYSLHHAYIDEFGFEDIIDTQQLDIDGQTIRIEEEETGNQAPLTPWDREEKVPPGDIVNIHWFINNKEASTADPIWLSNRQRGSRYFSWLDVVKVHDRLTGVDQVKIIQRLTDDNEMEQRKWKILTIQEDKTTEETLTYEERHRNPLGVKLVNFSNTGLMAMGFHSDILQGFPSLFFPFLYPFFTALLGVILLILALRLNKKTRKGRNI